MGPQPTTPPLFFDFPSIEIKKKRGGVGLGGPVYRRSPSTDLGGYFARETILRSSTFSLVLEHLLPKRQHDINWAALSERDDHAAA